MDSKDIELKYEKLRGSVYRERAEDLSEAIAQLNTSMRASYNKMTAELMRIDKEEIEDLKQLRDEPESDGGSEGGESMNEIDEATSDWDANETGPDLTTAQMVRMLQDTLADHQKGLPSGSDLGMWAISQRDLDVSVIKACEDLARIMTARLNKERDHDGRS